MVIGARHEAFQAGDDDVEDRHVVADAVVADVGREATPGQSPEQGVEVC